jgi:hypothetical protein
MDPKKDPSFLSNLITKNNILEHLTIKEIQKSSVALRGIVRKTPRIEAS